MEIPSTGDRYSAADVREFYAEGCWSSDTFGRLVSRQAATYGAKTFITDGTSALTYTDVHRSSLRLAAGLRQRGVRAGDRVVVQLPNWAEFAVVAVAIARLGAIMVPIMPIYRRDEVGHVLADSDADVVVTASVLKGFDYLGMYRELQAGRPSLHTVVVVRGDDAVQDDEAGVVTLTAVIPDVDPAVVEADLGEPVGPDDPFVIVYTSGTTARPKGCVHTFNTYASGARALEIAFAYTEDDVQFGPSPVTHTTGLVTSILLPMLHGGATHVMPDWEPVRSLEEIARYRCSVSVTATTFLQMLMDAYDSGRHDTSSLRAWVCAGSPIPRAVVERARRLLPTTKILSLYGRSENLTTTTCTVADDPERALASDGSALPFSAVMIVDNDGLEAPVGTEGDIAYKGPSHMLGYLGQPEETAALYTPDGYSRSGDLGVMDPDGFVRVTGRTKDIIIRGGMNISVREIEDLLAAHPAVRTAAAIGMPDERLGERVCCYLVPVDQSAIPTLAALKEYLTGKGVAVQKTPERLEVLDALPTTATGKIQKHLLRRDIVEKLGSSPTSEQRTRP